MVKKIISISAIMFLLAHFNLASAQRSKQNTPSLTKTDVKFLDNIAVNFEENNNAVFAEKESKVLSDGPQITKVSTTHHYAFDNAIESITSLQLKYGILLNIEVEFIKNFNLYQTIDEWYGTPYHLGGTSKMGIDCSAFVRAVYTTLFGILLPRTAREQYTATRQILRSELKEGDLVFFNTLGGVSHVGIYLQNNKFVHAASSEGVMISDLDDSYWTKRFIGATRYDMAAASTILSQPQP